MADNYWSVKRNCKTLLDTAAEFFHTFEHAPVEKLDKLIQNMEAAVADLRRIHTEETDPNREKV
jgi:hypothetical protein